MNLVGLPAARAPEHKPNIVVIFGDDIGYMNVSSYGGDIMGSKTPTSTASPGKACG
ncbi:MAG TPA: hypothetical protein VI032_07315 [Burkholderiaceae bacterium]